MSQVRYLLQYRFENSLYWNDHHTRDSLKEAKRLLTSVLTNERDKGTGTVWRIVRLTPKVVVKPIS